MHKINLRKIVDQAENAKTLDERWRLIAWSLAFEGSFILSARLSPTIKLTNTEEDVIMRWKNLVTETYNQTKHAERPYFGSIYKCSNIPGSKKRWDWRIQSLGECKFMLENTLPYIPSARKRKVAELLLQFCSRAYGSHYTPSEYELQRQIVALNAKGDKK